MEAWLLVGRLWSQCLCLQSPVARCFGAVHIVLYPVASPKMPEELRCRRYQAPSTSPISPSQPRTPPYWELIATVFFFLLRTLSSVTAGCLGKSADVSHLRWLSEELQLQQRLTWTAEANSIHMQHCSCRFKTIQPRCAPNRVGKGQLGKWGHPADSAFRFDLLVS